MFLGNRSANPPETERETAASVLVARFSTRPGLSGPIWLAGARLGGVTL